MIFDSGVDFEGINYLNKRAPLGDVTFLVEGADSIDESVLAVEVVGSSEGYQNLLVAVVSDAKVLDCYNEEEISTISGGIYQNLFKNTVICNLYILIYLSK